MIKKGSLLLLTALLFMSGIASAQDTVGTGTVLQGTLSADLSSATASVGDKVVLSNAHDDSDTITGTLYGQVTDVQKGGQGSHARLTFVINQLDADGATYSVTAVSEGITSPGAKSGKVTTAAALGALGGALLGKFIGRSTTAALVGAVVGGGTSFLITSNNYQDIVLQQGSIVKVRLQSVTRAQAQAPQ